MSGSPAPEVTWHRNQLLLVESERLKFFREGGRCRLLIDSALMSDEGDYKCVARTSAGTSECAAKLYVTEDSL